MKNGARLTKYIVSTMLRQETFFGKNSQKRGQPDGDKTKQEAADFHVYRRNYE